MNQDLTQRIAYANATFMSRVYFWMMIGLVVSGVVAYYVANNETLMLKLVGNQIIWIALLIAQFGAVIVLTAIIDKLSVFAATSIYLGYAVLSGITLSVIFLVFTLPSIYQVFFITAFAFTGLSAFGYLTKRDLGPVGSFCMIGLFGLIGFMLVVMLFPSLSTTSVQMTINVLGIMIFAGLTAWDTQKIKNYNPINASSDVVKKQAIHGALNLYLDFINLFLNLLNLFGRRR